MCLLLAFLQAPLFGPFDLQPQLFSVAALTTGAPSAPASGPWCALCALYAGTHRDVQAWDLRGPLSTRPGRIRIGAATLVLNGFDSAGPTPLIELATLQAGNDKDCWTLIDTDRVRPFPDFCLKPGYIRDRHGIFIGDQEYEAYWRILVLAHYTSAKAFTQAARHDVTYAHLFNEPKRYRGQVVHLSGRLIRLLRFDPPDEARAQGVSDLYEGWIMTDAFGQNPACIAFTDLPPGWKIDAKRKLNVPVEFDGYFYKRYRYKAFDTKKANEFRDAPMLIGHTFRGTYPGGAVSEDEEDNWQHNIIWVFLGVVIAAAAAVLAMTLWFRYHDRQVRRRIGAVRDREFVPPGE